jgi:ABC-type phosphate transport system substrate-binding protein
MRNSQVSAAVAAILAAAASAAAVAANPTAVQAEGYQAIYAAGSSAYAGGLILELENPVCGSGNWSEWDSDTSPLGAPDFRVVSCTGANGVDAGSFAGQNFTVYIRPEGGSAVGVYSTINRPAPNNVVVAQLNLAAFTSGYAQNGGFDCPQTPAANTKVKCNLNNGYINGTSPNQGPGDTWNTTSLSNNGVFTAAVDIGINDLEPWAFGNPTLGTAPKKAAATNGSDDPIAGTTNGQFTFLGADRSTNDLANAALLPQSRILQQTFGFIVNTDLGITDLPKEAIAAIFSGSPGIINGATGYPDWGLVMKSGGGGTVAPLGTTINVCNREAGSGTRGSADVFLTEEGCTTVGSQQSLFDYQLNGYTLSSGGTMPNNNYATALELDCVSSNPDAIGYVSVDNFTKLGVAPAANAVSITVDGIAATNLNAAIGTWTDVYEAYMTHAVGASAQGVAMYNLLVPVLQNINKTTQLQDILAIPHLNAANTVTYGPTHVGLDYVSNFTRSGDSCGALAKQQ